jgi:hypothetical protein
VAGGTASELTGEIPVNGSRVVETSGGDTPLLQGWAELSTARSIGGTAIFRQRAAGTESEAAVPLKRATTRSLLLPFDNTQGFVTGAGLVNPSATERTVVSALFRDENGGLITNGSIDLPPRGQVPFSLLADFPALANRRGVAEFSSPNLEIAGLGLRFSPQRTFTSLEALPSQPAQGSISQAISQVADRDLWKTTIILVNTGAVPAPFTLRFHGPNGGALQLPIGGVPMSEVSGELPLNGSRFIETDGGAGTVAQGWAELVSQGAMGATAIFRQQFSDTLAPEGAVPAIPRSEALRPLVLPFDNTGGFQTGIALVNLSSAQASITATFYDESGAQFFSAQIVLPGGGHKTLNLATDYPNNLPNRRGTAVFFAQGVELFGLGLRFSPSSTFTSLPTLRK